MAVAEESTPNAEMPLAGEFANFADLLRRSTVQVRSGRHGAGSGIIWRSDGLIISNAHVVRQKTARIELWDGRTFEGELVSRNEQRDLAAVQVRATDLPAAVIADSDALRVGQLVAAVGNPFGLSGALTLGIIHAIAPSEGHGPRTWVQADVRLAPGNSGGPLADVQGRVIGVSSMIAGGLGLAVPSSAVEYFLQSNGQRPQLGLTMQPVALPTAGRQQAGLLVLEVAEGSPASKAGVMIGDILVGLEGRVFNQQHDLFSALSGIRLGEVITVELLRGGVRMGLHVAVPSSVRSDAVIENTQASDDGEAAA
jgi:serine protease Do